MGPICQDCCLVRREGDLSLSISFYPSLCQVRTERREPSAGRKTGRKFSPDTKPCPHLDFELSRLQNSEKKKFLLFKLPSLCVLLWQPEQTMVDIQFAFYLTVLSWHSHSFLCFGMHTYISVVCMTEGMHMLKFNR